MSSGQYNAAYKKIEELLATSDVISSDIMTLLKAATLTQNEKLEQVTLAQLKTFIADSSSVVVPIQEMSDFPTPVAGVITLESGKQYNILENLTTSDRFQLPFNGTVNFRSAAFNILSITYTGSGTLFTGSNVGFLDIFDLILIGNSSATLFDLTGSGSTLSQMAFIQSLAQDFGSLGSLILIRPFMTASAFVNSGGIGTGGFTFTDCEDLRIDEVLHINTSDLGATFYTIAAGTSLDIFGRFTGMTFNGFPTENAFDISSGIGSDSFIQILASSFLGTSAAFASGSLDEEDVNVVALSSVGPNAPENSRSIGAMISQGNDIATVITTQGVGESNYVDFELGQASGSITVFADSGSGGTTVTSTAHNQPDEKLIGITGTTSYNGQHEIFSQTVNTFDIDVVFVADDATGSWTAGAFADTDIERWELDDASNGTLKYIGIQSFSGELVATISALAIGGASKRYKFRMVKSTDGGSTFSDGFAIPNEISNNVTETTLRKGIIANINDLFKIQVANFQDTSNIIIDTVSIGIK